MFNDMNFGWKVSTACTGFVLTSEWYDYRERDVGSFRGEYTSSRDYSPPRDYSSRDRMSSR